jgi:HPP family
MIPSSQGAQDEVAKTIHPQPVTNRILSGLIGSLSSGLLVHAPRRTAHPPAGANPITMIYARRTLSALWQPVFVGVLSLAVVAAVWSRLYPGISHYPLLA